MRHGIFCWSIVAAALVMGCLVATGRAQDANLLTNGGFEDELLTRAEGGPFRNWWANLYEGQAQVRGSSVAHSGKQSALIWGGSSPKIRIAQLPTPEPEQGRMNNLSEHHS